MPRKPKKTTAKHEEPCLVDEPELSLEWLERNLDTLFEAVRRRGEEDPWSQDREELDALTERRRRKLESISLNVEDESGESVA